MMQRAQRVLKSCLRGRQKAPERTLAMVMPLSGLMEGLSEGR